MSYNILTKEDLKKAKNRYVLGSGLCPGYELQAAPSMVFTLGPAVRKIVTDDEEYKRVLDSLFTYYNTNPYAGGLIMGSCLAVYEDSNVDIDKKIEAVSAIKTGLMGPLAGIGDAILSSLPMTIFGSLCSYMALEGNPAGIFIGMLFSAFMTFFVKRWLYEVGYIQGSKFLGAHNTQIKNLIKSASILGLTVIGALMATTVKLSTSLKIVNGDLTIAIQDTLNKVSNNLLPALLVVFVYWLLGRKKMTSVKVIIIVIALGIVGYYLKIFG